MRDFEGNYGNDYPPGYNASNDYDDPDLYPFEEEEDEDDQYFGPEA